MPISDIPGSRMERLEIHGGARCFIMENLPLETVLFDRNLVGLDFTTACEYSSRYFFEHFSPELRGRGEQVAELMILSKGMYYWMHNAFASVYNENLQTNFVATNRTVVKGDSAEIRVSYFNFDAPAPTLVIGDTVASGATVCSALSAYAEQCELREVFLFAIAGARIGVERIAEFCSARGIDLFVGFGLAAFGLGMNGFDLSFLHPDTITKKDYRERAALAYHGLPLSAVGWDFGSQAQAPRKYRMLSWLEARRWGIENEGILREVEEPSSYRYLKKEEAAYRSLPGPG